MPELPEVEITVRGLKKKVLNRAFIDIWSDAQKIVKKPGFEDFKKEIKNRRIKNIWRRGKNIIFDLSGDLHLLVHLKMTGHFLYNKTDSFTHLKFTKSKFFI
jgi:formamidopyrimidine-DNA glycosylase